MHRITRMLSLRYLRIAPELYARLFTYKSGKRSAENEEFAPTFVKLRCDLLRDYDFTFLPDAAKGHFFCLCLLAPQLGNELPDNPDWLALQIGAKEPIDLSVLINAGFLEVVHLDTSTGEVQVSEEPTVAVDNEANNKSGNKSVTKSANNSDSSFSTREGKGRKVNKRERATAKSAASPPREKAAPPSDPSSLPKPENSQIERVVTFLREQIDKGDLQIEKLAHKAFSHLSEEEWEEVKRRLHTAAASVIFILFDNFCDLWELAMSAGCC